MKEPIYQYAIYEHPTDYPDKFVVRRWNVAVNPPQPDVEPMIVSDTIQSARQVIPLGVMLYPGRDPDRAIVELWF